MSLLERVDFVLVEPTEGGNVGSCCRALLNCGVERLGLVRPRFDDWLEARRLAVHAVGVLESARCHDSVRAAIASAQWVVGVSGRARKHAERKRPIGPTELVQRLGALPAGARAALLFGTERTGLNNAQLGRCQDVLCLPTSAVCPSMNLAQAVLAVAWTLRLADQAGTPGDRPARDLTSSGELDGLISHAERTLTILEYLDPQNSRLILDELRAILARARLDPREVSLFRGIFHKMDAWIARHGGPASPNQPCGPGHKGRRRKVDRQVKRSGSR